LTVDLVFFFSLFQRPAVKQMLLPHSAAAQPSSGMASSLALTVAASAAASAVASASGVAINAPAANSAAAQELSESARKKGRNISATTGELVVTWLIQNQQKENAARQDAVDEAKGKKKGPKSHGMCIVHVFHLLDKRSSHVIRPSSLRGTFVLTLAHFVRIALRSSVYVSGGALPTLDPEVRKLAILTRTEVGDETFLSFNDMDSKVLNTLGQWTPSETTHLLDVCISLCFIIFFF
jgi:hypothetical protein